MKKRAAKPAFIINNMQLALPVNSFKHTDIALRQRYYNRNILI